VEPVILLERHGPVGWLTFNRPDAGNALNAQMIEALPPAWAELDADPAVSAIVVTGAGRSFQTGLDMVQLSREPAALRDMSRRTRTADLRLTGWHLNVGKPIVTAVNGVCAGGGLHFVADSDVVIASTAASFLDPHVSVGQVSALEGIALTRRVAFGTVARMAFTGAHERLSAERAYQLGWVSELIDPPEQLRERAQQLAEHIGSNDAEALRATKRALWQAPEVGLRAARKSAASAR
jgi:enoyl-CoA hydratase/carnithine racemase